MSSGTRTPEANLEATRRYRAVDPFRTFYIDTKAKANQRGFAFDLGFIYLRELTKPMMCVQSGHPLQWHWDNPGLNPWKPSVDRIDSSKGYVRGNVQVVCLIYNLCKHRWSDSVVAQFRRGPNV